MSSLSAIFGLPPKEAVKYFDNKKLLPTNGWEEVNALINQHSFVVAQTAGFNVIGDINNAIKQARDQGWSHKQFQQNLEPILRAKGWWGKAVDPATGEILKTYPGTNRPVVYGSPARLRLIYDANMASSYAAGRRERQLATIKAFPYWRYVAVRDGRTRPAHAALNGQIWRADSPVWSSIYPPNGFRCRCTVQAVSEQTAKAEGIQDDGVMVEKKVVINKNSDSINVKGFKMPGGKEFYPDPGWDVAPGLVENLAKSYEALGSALVSLPKTAILPAVNILMSTDGVFSAWRNNPIGNFPLAVLDETATQAIGASTRVAVLSPETMVKQNKHKLTNEDYAKAQTVIDVGSRYQDTPNSLIFIQEIKGDVVGGYVLVVKSTQTGKGLFITSYRKLSRDEAIKDAEINRLLKKK